MSLTTQPLAGPDAYRTTGTSPTDRTAPACPARTYDALHLLGVGAVGRALLERLAGERRRVIAVTDSTATLYDAAGIDIPQLLRWKSAGRPLSTHPRAWRVPAADAIATADADILVDATSTDLDRSDWTRALTGALQRGACVISAAKAALCEAGAEWLSSPHAGRIGCNAVLGGTGRSFTTELTQLRAARSIAIVGNASTTAIIEAIEQDATFAEGAADAARRGFLEPDPELDFRGIDAAVKLAIVAGIITDRRFDPRSIPVEDVRNVDVLAVRARARRNATTRLVGRWSATDGLHVRYEELPRDSLLAAPCGRVVYEYRLPRDERRLHIGTGLGAAATADALWTDLRCIAPKAAFHAAATAGAR